MTCSTRLTSRNRAAESRSAVPGPARSAGGSKVHSPRASPSIALAVSTPAKPPPGTRSGSSFAPASQALRRTVMRSVLMAMMLLAAAQAAQAQTAQAAQPQAAHAQPAQTPAAAPQTAPADTPVLPATDVTSADMK